MKYYTISQETVDEIKRRLKIRTQMIKFYQNMVREKRDSEPLEEIGVGGFEPVEEGVVIDARDKSSMIPDMMVCEDLTPSNDKALSIFENFEKFAKQNVEMCSNNKDLVIKDLQNEVYRQHQTIEDLQNKLDAQQKVKYVFDFYDTKDYEQMDRAELISIIHETTTSLKQVIRDNNTKAEILNKMSYGNAQAEYWKHKYEAEHQEAIKLSDGGKIISYDEYKEKVDELELQLHDLEMLNHNLTTERDGLEASMESAKKTYTRKIDELKAELEAEKAKTNSMMALSNKVQSTAENYDSASKKTIEELRGRIERQARIIDDLEKLNSSKSSELEYCKGAINDLEKVNSSKSSELEYYKEKLIKAENDIETLNTTIDKLSFTLNSRKSPSDYDDLKNKIGEQADTIENLAVSNQCLSNKNRKLSDTIDKLNSDIDILQRTVDKLNGMIGPRDSEDLKDRIFVVQSYANNNSIRYYISIDKKEIQSSVRLAKEMNKYFNLVIKEDNK